MSMPEWVQLLMWPVTVFLSCWSLASAIQSFGRHKRRAAEYVAEQEASTRKLEIANQAETVKLTLMQDENLRWFDESCRNGVWLPIDDVRSITLPKGYQQICGAELGDGLHYVYIVPAELDKNKGGYGSVPYGPPAQPYYVGSGQIGSYSQDGFSAYSGRIG